MKAHDTLEVIEARRGVVSTEPHGGSLWKEAIKRRLGKLVLAVCPQGRAPCANVHCALRPLCDCARADLAAARRFENRVWLVIALCGALALAFALLRSVAN